MRRATESHNHYKIHGCLSLLRASERVMSREKQRQHKWLHYTLIISLFCCDLYVFQTSLSTLLILHQKRIFQPRCKIVNQEKINRCKESVRVGSNLLYVHGNVVKQSIGPIRKNNERETSVWHPVKPLLPSICMWSKSLKFPLMLKILPISSDCSYAWPPTCLTTHHDCDRQLRGGGVHPGAA